MKDQYFGDINDYRKYGVLRAVVRAGELRLLVAWMLTPDDGSTDGKFISYLEHPDKWSRHDSDLFHKIKELLNSGRKRQVSLIESAGLFPKAEYFSPHVLMLLQAEFTGLVHLCNGRIHTIWFFSILTMGWK